MPDRALAQPHPIPAHVRDALFVAVEGLTGRQMMAAAAGLVGAAAQRLAEQETNAVARAILDEVGLRIVVLSSGLEPRGEGQADG